jgi:hypothetical protein
VPSAIKKKIELAIIVFKRYIYVERKELHKEMQIRKGGNSKKYVLNKVLRFLSHRLPHRRFHERTDDNKEPEGTMSTAKTEAGEDISAIPQTVPQYLKQPC